MQQFILHHNIPTNYTLKSDQIDLWSFPLHQALDLNHTILNPDEHKRAHNYCIEKHRRRFINTRTILRVIIAQYLKIKPHILDFAYGKNGKPFLAHYPKFMFNVSHANDWALIAIGCNYQIGVDLEWFSDKPYLGIARHCFAQSEIDV